MHSPADSESDPYAPAIHVVVPGRPPHEVDLQHDAGVCVLRAGSITIVRLPGARHKRDAGHV
jgi:hypothetical protein